MSCQIYIQFEPLQQTQKFIKLFFINQYGCYFFKKSHAYEAILSFWPKNCHKQAVVTLNSVFIQPRLPVMPATLYDVPFVLFELHSIIRQILVVNSMKIWAKSQKWPRYRKWPSDGFWDTWHFTTYREIFHLIFVQAQPGLASSKLAHSWLINGWIHKVTRKPSCLSSSTMVAGWGNLIRSKVASP